MISLAKDFFFFKKYLNLENMVLQKKKKRMAECVVF